jgi:DNA invertase Pin-like site-specific DNA recombinase
MGYPVVREYVEHENGGKGIEYRKQLAAMFAGAARREFDLLLVWSLDRFSREGMAATVGYLQRLASRGVAFRSFTEEHLSTENELVRNILLATLASLAKLEREKISQRTKAGLERARARGKVLGRPRFSDGDRSKLVAALQTGDSWHAVSTKTRIRTTLPAWPGSSNLAAEPLRSRGDTWKKNPYRDRLNFTKFGLSSAKPPKKSSYVMD